VYKEKANGAYKQHFLDVRVLDIFPCVPLVSFLEAESFEMNADGSRGENCK
jgi:hypothetical protein